MKDSRADRGRIDREASVVSSLTLALGFLLSNSAEPTSLGTHPCLYASLFAR